MEPGALLDCQPHLAFSCNNKRSTLKATRSKTGPSRYTIGCESAMHLTTFNYLPAAALAAAAAFLRAMKRSRADMTAVSSFRFAALACEKKSTNSGPRFLLPVPRAAVNSS